MLCKVELATQEHFEFVFKKVLQEKLLPYLKAKGRATVGDVRGYVRRALKAMDLKPTKPVPAKDRIHTHKQTLYTM